MASARARPSRVEVPRPISSRITSDRPVAWLRMRAVSVISTMKVDCPFCRKSDAPMRVKMRSTRPKAMASAGTKEPVWASTTSSAAVRRKVDLPPMLGPVTTAMGRASGRSRSLGMHSRPRRLSSMGWRAAVRDRPRSSARVGRTQPPCRARSAKAASPSSLANACEKAVNSARAARTESSRALKIRVSIRSWSVSALRRRCSKAMSFSVVKRSAFARVCLRMKWGGTAPRFDFVTSKW